MEYPELSQYVDYRQYLADFYKHRVQESQGQLRPYSYSDFSAAADIKSPNYLKLIIEGKRNLSMEMCKNFSRALKHNRSQAKEFSLLVRYAQEKDPMQRNRNLKELSEYRAKRMLKAGEIDQKTWEQVSNWLVWVLYAMVDQKDLRFEACTLIKYLKGLANEAQIQQAMDQLIKAGDVVVDPESKKARKTGNTISGVDQIPAELVRKIQSELIYLGLESMHKYTAHEREVSGFTLAMTKKEYEWVRFELRKLRKQIQKEIAMKREEGPGERVYQMNLQLFPLTAAEPDGPVTERPLEH
jgi:uncharacterized protein (TIGR02147 family)